MSFIMSAESRSKSNKRKRKAVYSALSVFRYKYDITIYKKYFFAQEEKRN